MASHLVPKNVNWATIESGFEGFENPTEGFNTTLLPMARELGMAAFPSQVLSTLYPHLAMNSIRIWLDIDPDLRYLPWECVWIDGSSGFAEGFLSLHPHTVLIREVEAPFEPETSERAGRLLIAWANPGSKQFPFLHGITSEVNAIKRALESHECSGTQVLELPYATPTSIRKAVEDWQPDMLHFVGHGSKTATGCVVAFEGDQRGHAVPIHGEDLSGMLAGQGLRMVVFSGCFTGTAVSGLADNLVAKGVPSVIAMQAPIQDAIAGLFARAFYSSLAVGESLELALQSGRIAIRGSGNDWAVPVLYQSFGRSDNSILDHASSSDAQLAPRHNLVVDGRPFIGRELERSELSDRIRIKHQRLITLTGMGGMGKSTLARKVIFDLLDDFPGGVWQIECDLISGKLDLLGAIASTVGASQSGSIEDIVANISDRRILLYFDCFEHLISWGSLLEQIISRCPDCHVIVSSRIVLNLNAEHEYRLSPMVLSKKPSQISDSMKLFLDAASHAVKDFELNKATQPLVRDLCLALEGVPLALVLAAGRLRHMSIKEIADQVQIKPLDVLRRKGTLQDRHANMQRVVNDSFRLLDVTEQDFLINLSLFSGNFSAEDVAIVLNLSQSESQEWLSQLQDNSLVQHNVIQAKSHFKLLDTVREYVGQILLTDNQAIHRSECASRHSELFAISADQIGLLMGEGRWTEGTALLWSKIGNLRSAIGFLSRGTSDSLIKRFCDGLLRSFFDLGLLDDLQRLASLGLDASLRMGDKAFEGRIYGLLGACHAINKELPKCVEVWNKRFEICQELGDAEGAADALTDLAWEFFELGQSEKANEYLATALELAKKVENHGLLATCYVQWAQISSRENNLDRCRYWIDKCEESVSQSPEKTVTPFVYQSLALLYEKLDEPKNAEGAVRKVLKLALESDRYRVISWSLLFLSRLHEQDGVPEKSALCLWAATKQNREFSTRNADKVKTAWSQLTKRYPELTSATSSQHLRTPWRDLTREIVQMKESLSVFEPDRD